VGLENSSPLRAGLLKRVPDSPRCHVYNKVIEVLPGMKPG